MSRWRTRGVVGLLLLTAGSAPAQSPGPTRRDTLEVLRLAAESLLVSDAPGHVSRRLYVRDSTTQRAIRGTVLKTDAIVTLAVGQVWCEDREGTGRTVGVTLSLHLDSLTLVRALVRWSATCTGTAAASDRASPTFGEMGVYEIARIRGSWQFARSLMHLVL